MDLLKSKAKSTLGSTEALENGVFHVHIVNTSCIGKTAEEAHLLPTQVQCLGPI